MSDHRQNGEARRTVLVALAANPSIMVVTAVGRRAPARSASCGRSWRPWASSWPAPGQRRGDRRRRAAPAHRQRRLEGVAALVVAAMLIVAAHRLAGMDSEHVEDISTGIDREIRRLA